MNYYYKALNIKGIHIRGSMFCKSQDELYKVLRDKGFYLTHYRSSNKLAYIFKSRFSYKYMYIFCKKMYSLLNCGIPILKSLSILIDDCKNNTMKKSLMDIKNNIQSGESFYNSLNSFKDIYPVIMLNMVSIGESTGCMDKIFHELSDYFFKRNKMLKKIQNALAYPILVFIMCIIMMIFMMIKVIPIFQNILESSGANIPYITKIMMEQSNFVSNNYIAIILLFILIVFGSKCFFTTLFGKKLLSYTEINLPIVRYFYLRYEEYEFTKDIGMLLNCGLNLIDSLGLLSNNSKNEFIKLKLEECINEIVKGKKFSESIIGIKILEPYAVSMVKIGEETGKIGEMFCNISNLVESDMDSVITKLISMIEPTIIVIVGIFLGFIILSIILPVLNVMDSF